MTSSKNGLQTFLPMGTTLIEEVSAIVIPFVFHSPLVYRFTKRINY